MDANPDILVVLSDDLLGHLRNVAQKKRVPLRWLVAGLVCDTFEAGINKRRERETGVERRCSLATRGQRRMR